MKKAVLSVVMLIGFSAHARAASAACKPIPGADQIWSNKALRWVWIGETHGSNEIPAAFGNLVCDALARGRTVTVALERPFTEQAAFDGIVLGSDLPAAKKVLLNEPGWRDGMDGRESVAMLSLLTSLRELRRHYPTLKVLAMEGAWDGTIVKRDQAMANSLLVAGTDRPGALILVLSGNVHGMLAPLFGHDNAAMLIPRQQLLSLLVTNARGSVSWTSSQNGCGASPAGVADKDKNRSYGIYLDPALAPIGKVDGILALGVPLTASLPAVGSDPTPLPECRSKFLSIHADTEPAL